MPGPVTLCLFYQYAEPAWTAAEHKRALREVVALANKHQVTGRGRCAPEGLNCTLTGPPEGTRAFCKALVAWKPAVFGETDFKFTDNLAESERFKAFSLRKTDELVAYGLEGAKAPSLKEHHGEHLDAAEYHKRLEDPDAVVIDVRNAYESTLGHLRPPPGGATLIDPRLRNSGEFAAWLNADETKAQLQGKNVLMYCTGGIRCERASALLNKMQREGDDGFQVNGVSQIRGGLERYLKTHPDGGYWTGANYLFDKRMEQLPGHHEGAALASAPRGSEQLATALAAEILEKHESAPATVEPPKPLCVVCTRPYALYRGQFKCSDPDCKVPVIVCPSCAGHATRHPHELRCPLCVEGYHAPKNRPAFLRQRGANDTASERRVSDAERRKVTSKKAHAPNRAIVVSRLPLHVSAEEVRLFIARLGGTGTGTGDVQSVQWLVDPSTNGFYGSALVTLATEEQASAAVEKGPAVLADQLAIAKRRCKKRKRHTRDVDDILWAVRLLRTQRGLRIGFAAPSNFANVASGEVPPLPRRQ